MQIDDGTAAARIRVAIVDDHAMVAEGLARIVAGEGDFDLSGVATTVAESVELAARERPHVVLMDYLLPDGDGVQASEEILRRFPETRIVMLSGLEGSDLLGRAIEAGCVGLLGKNRPGHDVIAAVRSAARGESVMRSDQLATLLGQIRGKSSTGRAHDLTARELEVLRLLAKGMATEAIAKHLYLSVNTIRNHVSNVLTKLGAHSKLEAVAVAVRDQLIAATEIG